MKKRSILLLACVVNLFERTGYANPTGSFFNVSVSGTTLSITTTTPHHTYRNAGILIQTPGYAPSAGCTFLTNGYCLFSVSDTSPTSISIAGNSGNISLILTLNGIGPITSQQKFDVSISSTPLQQCQGPNGQCRVFLTNAPVVGNMSGSGIDSCTGSGLSNANCICNLDANYPGTGNFHAWLSTSSTSALTNISFSSTNTYIATTNSSSIIADPSSGFPNSLLEAIAPNADFHTPWTGTTSNGMTSGDTCDDWTSAAGFLTGTTGDSTAITSDWTDEPPMIPNPCNSQTSLYCFEVPS